MTSGKPWTDDDRAAVLAMLAADKSAQQIADALGRSRSALAIICSKWGISLATRRLSQEPIGGTFVPAVLADWPADARFEDDPRVPATAPPWRAPPVLAHSPVGCAAALCAAT